MIENIYVNGRGMSDHFRVRQVGSSHAYFEVERRLYGRRKWLVRGDAVMAAGALMMIGNMGFQKKGA